MDGDWRGIAESDPDIYSYEGNDDFDSPKSRTRWHVRRVSIGGSCGSRDDWRLLPRREKHKRIIRIYLHMRRVERWRR